jgi:hypothetical protein
MFRNSSIHDCLEIEVKNFPVGLACAIVTFCCPVAALAVPEFSGVYIVSTETVCPVILKDTSNVGGQLTGLNTTFSGDVRMNVMSLTLTPGAGAPNAGTITGTGFNDELEGTLKVPGFPISASDQSTTISGTFSNTRTSLTVVSDQTSNFNIEYGAVVNNVVQYAAYTGLSTENNGNVTVTCIQKGTITLK